MTKGCAKKYQKGVSLIITLFTTFYIFLKRWLRATDNMIKSKILNTEKGVSLIITLFIMIIILAVVISVSALLYSEVKVMRNLGNSVVGLYSADSGIEKVLYYDRQVQPTSNIPCTSSTNCNSTPKYPVCQGGVCVANARGLCAMLDSNNTKYCKSTESVTDTSAYCNPNNSLSGFTEGHKVGNDDPAGCDPNVCDDCTISFDSVLDPSVFGNNDAVTYTTTARVYSVGTSNYFEINSKGAYGGAGRQIYISIKTDKQP